MDKLPKKIREYIADSLADYLDVRTQLLISNEPESVRDENIKKMKKLIKKIRKGDMSVFNEEMLEERLPELERNALRSERI